MLEVFLGLGWRFMVWMAGLCLIWSLWVCFAVRCAFSSPDIYELSMVRVQYGGCFFEEKFIDGFSTTYFLIKDGFHYEGVCVSMLGVSGTLLAFFLLRRASSGRGTVLQRSFDRASPRLLMAAVCPLQPASREYRESQDASICGTS